MSHQSQRLKRHYNSIDHLLSSLDHARLTLSDALPSKRSLPTDAQNIQNNTYASEQERASTSNYLRINHTGEVCAQALYLGQAAVATEQKTKDHLLHCAEEEQAHLQWCSTRLQELDAKPSVLNPLWYGLSFLLGTTVARMSDKISLGFIHATETQVKRHLEEHLQKIPESDHKTRDILSTMLKEEIEHADAAIEHGGRVFPRWIQALMWASSRIMTFTSARF